MEPYSPLFGHFAVMRELRRGLSPDDHQTHISTKVIRDWKKYFPAASECPSVVHLDLWPIVPQPFTMVISPRPGSHIPEGMPKPEDSVP